MITLRGMTWNHPRGLDPLVAHAREYEREHRVRIEWDARSLEEFEALPIDELAAKYDLMVIDHPHAGMAAASGCLLALDSVGHEAELNTLKGQTVGDSHESYHYAGRQWALAIDAATQVAARRADLLPEWPRHFGDLIKLSEEGRVLLPLAPVHALMCFLTLCANMNKPCATQGNELVDAAAGEDALGLLGRLTKLLPEFCFEANPITIYERMIEESRYAYCPLIYGYVSYARDDFREHRIDFGDIPVISQPEPIGSTLGGTGVAVSARSKHRDAAVAVAFDLASAEVQRGIYAFSGGQPAHRSAWLDKSVNDPAHDFYLNTLATLDHAVIRPRFDGYIAFQAKAGELVQAALRDQLDHARAIRTINNLFREAQKR